MWRDLQMFHFRRHGVEGRVAVDFVLCGFEQRLFVRGIAGTQISGSDHPDANPFIPSGVNVAGIFYGHLGVDCVQATDVLMSKPVLAPNENLPERPLIHKETPLAPGTP
jgi:hypothetical protein